MSVDPAISRVPQNDIHKKQVISSAKWVIAITEDTTISANFAKYGLLLLGSSSGYLQRLAGYPWLSSTWKSIG